jgi:hypothetical protein
MRNQDRKYAREIQIGPAIPDAVGGGYHRTIYACGERWAAEAFVRVTGDEVRLRTEEAWLQILEERTAEAITRLLLD